MADARYDMPTFFGPSIIPDYSEPTADLAIVTFLTDAAPLEAILPAGFALAGDPVMSVSMIDYSDVDYLGGRGYKEVVISFPTRFEGKVDRMNGGFAPVLWVSEPGALMAGREFMGLPKLMAEFETAADADRRSFRLSEYGAPLMAGSVHGMKPLSAEQLAKVQERSQEVCTFGWKHIPAAGGVVDLAYPLVNVMRWQYEQAWTGEGEVQFFAPDAAAAPFGSRAARFLAGLPVREVRRSFIARGRAKIDRLGTRPLK